MENTSFIINKLKDIVCAVNNDTITTKAALDEILLELKDDVALSETVWYDKTDVTKFYIRKISVNQDNGAIVVSFQNIDGTVATPITSNLIQSVTNGDIEITSTLYNVSTNGTGYSIGNIIEEIELVNTSTNTVSTIYYNKTTKAVITPVFSHLQSNGIYLEPSHIDLVNATQVLNANTYKFISLVILSGNANITIDGVTITNIPFNYTENWGNHIALINKTISITSNINSRVIINLEK